MNRLFKIWLLASLTLAVLTTGLKAQRTTIVLSQEIEVPEGVTITSNGPVSVRIYGRGIINSRQSEGNYIVSGKSSLPHVFVINKSMPINSWKKNTVRQVVTILVETKNNSQLQLLRQALLPELTLSPTNEVKLNYQLNIRQFTLNNGFFQQDNNSITLADGRVLPVEYLEIKNDVFVPENANLKFDLSNTKLSLGDHQGAIKTTSKGGSVSAGCLKNLDASISDGTLRIDAIKKAAVTMANSQLHLGLATELTLSSSLSSSHVDSIGVLVVEKSLSDHLAFGKVDAGSIHQAVFSSITLKELKTGLSYSGKNSHLSVLRARNTVQSFHAESQDGSVSFPIQDLPTAHLICSNIQHNQFHFPAGFRKQQDNQTAYDFQWGAKPSNSSVKLEGRRCEFNLTSSSTLK